MKYYLNTRNARITLYDINLSIKPGNVVAIPEDLVSKSQSLQIMVSKGVLKEVDATTPPINFVKTTTPDITLPDGVEPEKREMLNTDLDSQDDLGQIIVAKDKKIPGTAELKNVSDYIKEESTKMSEESSKVSEEIKKKQSLILLLKFLTI